MTGTNKETKEIEEIISDKIETIKFITKRNRRHLVEANSLETLFGEIEIAINHFTNNGFKIEKVNNGLESYIISI